MTYGFARAAYAGDIAPRGLSYPNTLTPLVPGSTNAIAFPSLPMDYVLKPGHRLRVTFGAGLGGTETALNNGGEVTLLLTGSTVRLPTAS
ncbi:MAG: X-Pro dipeptidyl-peptidase C-terminal non-catalytic domain [Frankiales bacterium]|nr:X-Pro dipeptidyl-peptidase C-terminal non-catalytic domain [Frankiales bacterium]